MTSNRPGLQPERLLPILATALAAMIGLVFAGAGFFDVGPPDTDAFWQAAQRLRDGAELYPATDPNADEVFRYAPWFAWIWVPLTYLPQELVYAAWSALLAVCALITSGRLFRDGWAGLALGFITLGVLLYAAGYGNPTPLITAALSLSAVHPLALGIAGSLKIYPLFLTAGLIAERRWRAVALAWGTAALLWSPALLYGLGDYVVSPGHGGVGLWSISPIAWLVIAIPVIAATGLLAIQGSRWAWVGGAAMIALAVPRVWPSELGYVATAREAHRTTGPGHDH